MILQNVLHSGSFLLKNVYPLQGFKVHFEHIDIDLIQVDVLGIGLLNFFGRLTQDLDIEMNTEILKSLKRYSDITEHDSSDIGYNFKLNQSKKLNRKYNVFETSIELSIVFKKPEGYEDFEITKSIVSLITATILAEIFIIENQWI